MNINWEAYTARSYMNKLKDAYSRGIDFQLTLDMYRSILEQTHCYYTGIPLTRPPLSHKGGIPNDYQKAYTDLSIERVDCKQGYVENNVVAVCHYANNRKSSHESCDEKWQKFDMDKFIKDTKEELKHIL